MEISVRVRRHAPLKAARRLLTSAVVLVSVVVLVGATGCGGADTAVSSEDVERAQTAAATFKKELQGALRSAMVGGPENAIEVCRIEAPAISERLTQDGVAVGRTSHRLRNPENAPETWMKPLLDEYASGLETRPYRALRLDDGRIAYVEPIFVQPLCLKCHGAGLSSTVSERIAELYPDDDAVGFEPGDFRGLFWVTIAERTTAE